MPVTLAQAKLNTQDDLDANVIDEFRKSSAILDTLIFHDAANPMGGGSTLTYGYHRVITQVAAAFRAINNEYTPAEATKQRFTTDLKPLGGSFQIDRVLAQVARGSEVTFQMQQLIKATTTKFQDEVINGDVGVDANGFDGLDNALTGSDTEIGHADDVTDWTNLDAAGAAMGALDRIEEFLMLLDGEPTAVIGNRYSIAKLAAIARRANIYVSRPVDGLVGPAGRPLTRRFFGENTMLIDAGEKAGSNQLIVPVYDPDNAIYSVDLSGIPTGGTFTVIVDVNGDVEETSDLAFNVSTADFQTALEALSNVGAGNATVTGTPGDGSTTSGTYTVTFGGDLATIDVTMRAGDNSLTGGTDPDVAVTEDTATGGFTDLYAVRVGMDGFHGVSVADQPMVQTWLPDFSDAGAVKTGEVEMGPVSVALKATKAAAVLRRIRVR
jgi:hypothetical protein